MDTYSITIILFIAGLAGGVINFTMLHKDEYSWVRFFSSISLGLGASFLTPLFLNTISSSLLSDMAKGSGEPGDVFVFLGFCLLAAISSRAFINTLSEKILKEAKDAKREATDAKNSATDIEKEIEPILTSATEQDIDAESEVSETNHDRPPLSEYEEKVLKALKHEKYTLRSLKGISEASGLDGSTVQSLLAELESLGYIAQALRPKGIRWWITPNGVRALDA